MSSHSGPVAAISSELFRDQSDRSRPIKPLPTDRVSPANQLRILRAWASVSNEGARAATVNEVAAMADMAASTVALCNPFFASTGLLQRLAVGTYMPSADVVAYFRASASYPDTAARQLASAFKNTWFAQTLMPTLMYAPMQERDALNLLEQTCAASGENKKAVVFLLEFLQCVAIIQRDNGLVRLIAPHSVASATLALQGAIGDAPYTLNLQIDSNWNSEQISALFQELAERFGKKQACKV